MVWCILGVVGPRSALRNPIRNERQRIPQFIIGHEADDDLTKHNECGPVKQFLPRPYSLLQLTHEPAVLHELLWAGTLEVLDQATAVG
jgi:hypothetical protein